MPSCSAPRRCPARSCQTQPQEVIFKFNQAVGGTLGAVGSTTRRANEVDDLDVSHPEGHEHWMGVGLKPGLPDGTYTATYRVISADTHIVYGGLVFSIGHAGPAPKFTVAGLISSQRERRDHQDRLWHRARPGLPLDRAVRRRPRVPAAGWLRGSRRGRGRSRAALGGRLDAPFRRRLRRLLLGPWHSGSLVSVLGHPAAGGERRGRLAVVLAERRGHRKHARQSLWRSVGRAGDRRLVARTACCSRAACRAASAPAARALLGLLVPRRRRTWRSRPRWPGTRASRARPAVFFPADVVHVLAASVWVGGIACLLLALPAATRELGPPIAAGCCWPRLRGSHRWRSPR